jgi:hypothetical protein
LELNPTVTGREDTEIAIYLGVRIGFLQVQSAGQVEMVGEGCLPMEMFGEEDLT